MKTWKITKNMREPIPGYREYVFWNDDENGKPIDKEWFRFCYETIKEFDRKQRKARGLDIVEPSHPFA